MADRVISRADAKSQGLKRYFTGEPCLRGHIAERYAKSRECLDCHQFLKSDAAEVKEEVARRIRNADLLRQARADGRATYSTGEPCKHGHLSDRRSLDSKCVECVRIRSESQWKRWANNNPAKRKASILKWRENNPEIWRDSNRASKERNKHKYIPRQKEYYQENKEKLKERYAQYYDDKKDYHLERAKVGGHIRRARKQGVGGTHTAADVAAILKAQGHRCPYCQADLRKVKRHIDHIMPIARGGSNDKTNIQILCEPCNRSKGAKDPIAFAREQGRLL